MPLTRPPRVRHATCYALSEPLERRTLLAAADVSAVALAQQPDGKLVVAGYQASNAGDFVVARYHADGTVDTTFGDGGRVVTDFDGASDRTNGVAVLPDGRIVVVGESYKQADGFMYAVARYNPDGSLDNSFDGDGKVRRPGIDPFAMAAGPDGKVVLAGAPHGWFDGMAVLRLDLDGSPDASFGDGGLAVINSGAATLSAHLDAVAVQDDGKVVFGGTRMAYPPPFSHIAPPVFGVIGRLAADGTRDGTGGYQESGDYRQIYDLALGPGGKVAFACVDRDYRVRVGRLKADLSADPAFGPPGGFRFDLPGEGNSTSLRQTPDGKVLVALAYSQGPSGPYSNYVARLTSAGALDPTFGGGDGLVSWPAADLVVQPSGRIVLAGTGTFDAHQDILLVALTNAGEPDPTFAFGQAPAHVTGAWVAGSAWSSAFRQFLAAGDAASSAAYGRALPAAGGPGPAAPLPWINLNQVAVRFDRPVSLAQETLHVRGVNVPAYAVSAFRYDADSATAVWTLARPLGADKITLELDPATLSAAQPLRFDVLPGDIDGDGAVVAADASAVMRSFFRSATSPGTGADAYAPLRDLNGSGAVLADDFSAVKQRFFTRLPGDDPAPVTAAAAQRKSSAPPATAILTGV